MSPQKIKVSIFGSEYSLVSDDDENYVQEIAQYLDKKMREIDRHYSLTSTTKVAILAALNIADELFQEREYRRKLLTQINEEARRVNHSITEILEEDTE